MKHKVWEIKNSLTDEQKDHIDNIIMSNDFPWYFQKKSTTNEFLYFSHMLLARGDDDRADHIPTPQYYFFENILKQSCKLVDLNVKKVLRACLNLNINCFDRGFPHGDPHIDFEIPHKLGIIYLNDCKGDTHIFKETHSIDNGIGHTYPLLEHLKKPLTIFKTIKPEKYKVLIFDGKHYHATSYPGFNDRRVIAVFNFQTEDDYGKTSDKK